MTVSVDINTQSQKALEKHCRYHVIQTWIGFTIFDCNKCKFFTHMHVQYVGRALTQLTQVVSSINSSALGVQTKHSNFTSHANLTKANLTKANLTEANLTKANLTEANLTKANLTMASLSSDPDRPTEAPETSVPQTTPHGQDSSLGMVLLRRVICTLFWNY